MSDRAPGQVVVYDCPKEKHTEVMSIFEEFDLLLDFGIGDEGPLEEGATYGDDDGPLDLHEQVSDALMKRVPEATFAAWVDPKYEYDGAIVLYAPDLGAYRGDCDSNGQPHVTSREVRAGLLAGDLEKIAGLAWLDRIEELQDPDVAVQKAMLESGQSVLGPR